MNTKIASKRALLSVLMVCVGLGLITVTSRVTATTFIVTNVNDSGQGSLRQAIIDANGTMGADVIDFAPGVTGTITLASALPQVTQDVRINGPGANMLTISGASSFQVFNIAGGVTASISDLTILNGNTVSFGGGINNSGTLTITGAVISGNSANSGGGIFNDSGATLTITNSTISGNSALDGGGIYNDSGATLTITDSTFSGNSASFGGGIYNFGATTITGSTISDNSAGPGGGAGIGNIGGGTLTINNSTLSGNSAGIGGGIRNRSGTLTVNNGTFSGNSAATGGGIFNDSGTTLTITNSTFSENSALDGGGIYSDTGAMLAITSSTFAGNTASFGGGIYNRGATTITGSTLSNNSGGSGRGGGIGNVGGTLTINNSTLSGNDAGFGGGIFNSAGTLTVNNSTLSGNSASSSGGIENSGPATVKNSIIANSPLGGNCGGTVAITAQGVNFTTDNTCAGFTVVPSNGIGGLNLGPLANNGGPTLTHALLAGSVAIDAVIDCTDVARNAVTSDQRGVTRPQGLACDVGAFEVCTITLICPEDVTAVVAQTCLPKSSTVVNFAEPTANCPLPEGAVVCDPPSGSTFRTGTTTVTCTATDASGNSAMCSFTVTVFSGCLQDDSDPTKVVLFNIVTGEYRFCCRGVVVSGVGTVILKGCDYSIQHNPADRRVLIKGSFAYRRGTASLQMPPGSTFCTITDRDATNNICQCRVTNAN